MLTVERTDQGIIIRLPNDAADIEDIQRMLNYLSYKHAIKNSEATQEEIDELADEVNSGWWEANKHRFPGLMEE